MWSLGITAALEVIKTGSMDVEKATNSTSDTHNIQVTASEVAKLYIAIFNRVPDAEGLDYWVNQVHPCTLKINK